ncbi:bacterio-opsin activator domain-containing protein [Halobacterium jilantaiense]|uniref:GAF domain-containing protein n=1 Tax=Halobacterium jilantaiense TaxID=355548 RepID=A0A1I0MX67_9EURY|nr:bacterio-opsin activator domain-containing protein [Halobacterium jilantaiense]SEV93245.1 hypothetical protein SAMN04487945_0437 [Halobacterium jilantaiense]
MDDHLRGAPVGVLEVNEDGIIAAANDAVRDTLVTDSPVGDALSDAFPQSVEDPLRAAFADESIDETDFEQYYPGPDKWLSVTVVPGETTAAVYVADVTDRRRREQAMSRLRAERDRTAVVEGVLADVLRGLVGAQSRDEIADAICAAFGAAELFTVAWVGERAVDGDELEVRAAADDTERTFDAVRDALADSEQTPEEVAVDTGQLEVRQELPENPEVPRPVRRAAFADGVQSALAIPLRYGSNVHGVVGVYTDEFDTVSERERTSFETLGEVAGFAVTAARNRSLLLSDTVTEVVFDVSDTALASLSRRADTTLSLDGLVAEQADELLCYVSADDANAAAVAAAAEETAGITRGRVVGADPSSRLELAVTGKTPLVTVTSLGGTVRAAEFESGSGRLVVELPASSDVRRMVHAVTREYDVSVTAKREREHSVSTSREFRDEVGDELTERQETVLRTAYFADYFESPRGSTAEEVGDSLDITGSTLLHHLRTGQRKLLDAYFEADGERQ